MSININVTSLCINGNRQMWTFDKTFVQSVMIQLSDRSRQILSGFDG